VNARARVFKVRRTSGRKPGLNVRKKTELNRLITKILVYSAIKIRAKGPLLYSVLNPDTSSDSPSAKSNGVRFVSAKVVVNQIRNKGALSRIIGVHWLSVIRNMLYVIVTARALRRIRDILTS